jgi:hypothetical protein
MRVIVHVHRVHCTFKRKLQQAKRIHAFVARASLSTLPRTCIQNLSEYGPMKSSNHVVSIACQLSVKIIRGDYLAAAAAAAVAVAD